MSNGMTLTTAGRDLLALALTGTEINFTRGALGDGLIEGQSVIPSMTELVNEHTSLGIESIRTNQTGTCEVVMTVSNEHNATGLWLREYGLFAEDPEDPTNEILYAYCNKGGSAGYLEGYDGANPISFKLTLVTVIDQAQNITAYLIADDDFITTSELEDRIEDMYEEQAFIEAVQEAAENYDTDSEETDAVLDEIFGSEEEEEEETPE